MGTPVDSAATPAPLPLRGDAATPPGFLRTRAPRAREAVSIPGMFKFSGRAQTARLAPGGSTVLILSDDPFVPGHRAQGIAIRYPMAFPIQAYALSTYLNTSVPNGLLVTFYVLRNNAGTPLQTVYPSLSPGGVQTWFFSPTVDFRVDDGLDLAVSIENQFGATEDYAIQCSATLGYVFGP